MKRKTFVRAYELFSKHRQELMAKRAPAPGAPLQLAAKDAAKNTGSLYIYDVIGEDWWTGGGVTAQSVIDALAELKGVKTLDIFINSPGGDVFEAKAILTNLQRFEAEKVVHIDGLAASAATFIAMVGDKVITAEHANWMVHEAAGAVFGWAEDMRAMADLLDLQNGDLANAYAKKTGKSVEDVRALMAAETWMSAKEALDHGFTDEIAYAPQEDDEEEDAEAKAAAQASPFIRAALSTEERVRAARQARRLEQLTNSRGASPANPRVPASR